MIIDSLAGILPPQAMDAKVEKKKDIEAPRPIAQSNKSYDSQLDMAKQNISKKGALKSRDREEGLKAEIYNAKGSLEDTPLSESEEGQKHESLNLII